MNIRDMEYIVAVAKFGHFSNAADACCVSQPTLSSQIKKLEDYLGTPLFQRVKQQGHIIPTAAGIKIIKHAENILKQRDMIIKLAKQTRDPFVGDLRIGAFPTLAPYYLPIILPELKQILPELKFYIIEEKSDILIEMLKSDKLDIAFLAAPLNDDELSETPLFFDAFYGVVHHTHPLAQKDFLTPDDMMNENLLLLSEGHCLRTQALEFCHHIGKSHFDDFRASSPEMLLEMIRLNTGISLMPKLSMNQHRPDIKFIPFLDKTLGRTIGMVSTKTGLHPKLKQKIESVLLDSF